jgi:xanthine dehydrogenase YagS FAD-binding subunit
MLNKFTYQRARSIKEAVEAASRPGTRILGGGTDLLGCLRDEVFTAERVVSLSGVAPIPWRSAEAEKALVGKTLDAAAVSEAAAAAVKDALPLGGNEYKVPLVRGMLEETLLGLAG